MSEEYPSDWSSRRKRVYRRDNYECQNCGAKGGPKGDAELHAHHIVPKSKGGTHKVSNLKTVCKGCHDAIHTNKSAPTADSSSSATSSRSFIESIGGIPGLVGGISGLIVLVGMYWVASHFAAPGSLGFVVAIFAEIAVLAGIIVILGSIAERTDIG